MSFDFEAFKKNLKINIIKKTEDTIVFDVIGITPPLANALRRVMIAEVPTMAIEDVYIRNNTSILPDEMLAHRLGLIPIKADPRLFVERKEGEYTDKDTIVFNLHVKCEMVPGAKEEYPEEKKYIKSRVTSGDLVWEPQGEQEDIYVDNPIKPVYDDILIAKLRPGQEIDVVCYCEKNVGKEHAKWSPVSTATYRLMPEVKIEGDVVGEMAETLVQRCPMNVFDIEDLGKVKRAVVSRPRDCSLCRECIRTPELAKHVKLSSIKNHFIFTVESVGILKPEEIFIESIKVLLKKIEVLQNEFKELQAKS